jgi:protein phosphatase 1L
MEDFYETRISEVDGQMVAFFGVFDGICLSSSFP